VLSSLFLASLIGADPSGKPLSVPAKHKSIQEAIDQAKPGDTVLVSSGTYSEHIQLKEGVYLKSAGDDSLSDKEYGGRKPLKRAEQTIIDVKGSTEAAVVAGADGATLDGFTITGLGHVNHHLPGHAHAVECRNCSTTIIHNIIRDNGSTGIGQHAKKGAKVAGVISAPYLADNFIFRNKGIGIGNNHRSQTVILNNVVFNNHEAGIGARNEAAPLIEGNIVFGNGFGYKDLSPEECKKFDKDPRHIWPGIGVKDGGHAVIRNNKSYKNAINGISADNGAYVLIEGNEVYGNQYPGIGVGGHRAAQAVIRKNIIRDNGGPGIGVNLGSTVVIEENTIRKNGEGMPGIAITNGSTAMVIRNEIKPGTVAGIAVIESKATLSGNTIQSPQRAGIRVDESVVTIDGNEVTDAGTVGIFLFDSRVNVTRNKILSSTHHGILAFGKQCRANVQSNVLSGNGKKGGAHIFLDKSMGSRLSANKFSKPGPLGDVFYGEFPKEMVTRVNEMHRRMQQRRPDGAILGPGPTENFFKTGKEDHDHDGKGHGKDH
jgi:parallel beta-helix repeat protein